MDGLIEGVQEFKTGIYQEHRELFQRLKSGQNPDALFITCSDSRVNPNLITQTHPGQLFIIRNAGNIIPPHGAANGGEGATVEYAVLALGIRDIIVCGHSHCGAMQGVTHLDQLAEMPTVTRWLRHAEATRLIVRDKYPDLEGEELLTKAAQENVLVQIENLQTHPIVAARLATGRLKLHAWMYLFETGDVLAYDPAIRRFIPVARSEESAGSFQILDASPESDPIGATNTTAKHASSGAEA